MISDHAIDVSLDVPIMIVYAALFVLMAWAIGRITERNSGKDRLETDNENRKPSLNTEQEHTRWH